MCSLSRKSRRHQIPLSVSKCYSWEVWAIKGSSWNKSNYVGRTPIHVIKKSLHFILCVWVSCLHICLHIPCAPGAQGGQKAALDLLDLELQKVVSCHVGAENWTRVLCRAASPLTTELSLQPYQLYSSRQLWLIQLSSNVEIGTRTIVSHWG